MTKQEQIAHARLVMHNTIATIDAQFKRASLVEKCDLIKARIDAIQTYSATVTALCDWRVKK